MLIPLLQEKTAEDARARAQEQAALEQGQPSAQGNRHAARNSLCIKGSRWARRLPLQVPSHTHRSTHMTTRRLSIVLSALTAVACGGERSPLDDALRQDLSLASQAYAPQQFVSPLEGGYAPNGQYQPAPAPYGYAPAPMRSAPRVYRRASASSAGVYGGGGGRRVVKNTKRDAAIGAAAGAAIGAVTSAKRDRLKGAVIGAAVGAVLGGVVGNNVDLKRIPR